MPRKSEPLPTGMTMWSGRRVREVCGKLVGEGLCALQEVGAEVVGGVDEAVFFAEGDCGLGGGFTGAGDQVQLSAVDL